jgi:subtilisin family serine protease
LVNIDIPQQPPVAFDFAAGTNMYNLDAIGAPEAWSVGLTGAGIIVAVLDTGVDVTHIELDDNIWINIGEIPNNGIDDDSNGYIDDVNGWDFVNNDNSLEDLDGHGTHVAGTVSAENNGIGIVGAAFDTQIMPIKILPGTDQGGSYFNLAQGIYYAVDNGADVINMSLGGGYIPPQIIRDAIRYANDNNVICVMAAGNSFDDNPSEAISPEAPGSYASEYGIVVGAIDEAGNMTSFSNRAGQPVDWDNNGAKELLYVTTSGQAIWSTLPGNMIGTKSGTSMACPLIAAAVAILLQADPSLRPDQIRVLLANTTK